MFGKMTNIQKETAINSNRSKFGNLTILNIDKTGQIVRANPFSAKNVMEIIVINVKRMVVKKFPICEYRKTFFFSFTYGYKNISSSKPIIERDVLYTPFTICFKSVFKRGSRFLGSAYCIGTIRTKINQIVPITEKKATPTMIRMPPLTA